MTCSVNLLETARLKHLSARIWYNLRQVVRSCNYNYKHNRGILKEDYIRCDISDKAVHKVKYCDKQKEYYQKGVRANLRAENAKSTVSIFKNRIKVSGVVRFN